MERVSFPHILELSCRRESSLHACYLSASSIRLVSALGEGLCLIHHCILRHWLCARNDIDI